jgi:hypothetical protein
MFVITNSLLNWAFIKKLSKNEKLIEYEKIIEFILASFMYDRYVLGKGAKLPYHFCGCG